MSALSFRPARAIPRGRLERDRHTAQWAQSGQSSVRARPKGDRPFPAHGRKRQWRILHCPPVAIAGGAGGPQTAGSLGVPSPAASRAQETVHRCLQRDIHPMPGLCRLPDGYTLTDLSPAPLSPDIPLLCPVQDLCNISWGCTTGRIPGVLIGVQPEPTPGNSPLKGGNKAVLLFGHPHLL